MKTIRKLVETCIKPIITYAAETWEPTKTEMRKLNAILDNIIKRILQMPLSTPRENLYLEIGLMDIEHTMERNKMLMHARLKTHLTTHIKQNRHHSCPLSTASA